MQSVNDDMEDLIRRAAKDYPLDTSGADWSKVQKGLAAEEAAAPQQKKRDNRKFLLLLLLLPIGFLCNRYFINDNNESAALKAPQTTEISTEPTTVHDNNNPNPVPLSSTPAYEKSEPIDHSTLRENNSPMKTNREGGKMKTKGNGEHPTNSSAMNLPPPPYLLPQKQADDAIVQSSKVVEEKSSTERQSLSLLKGKDYSNSFNQLIPSSVYNNTQFLNKSVTIKKDTKEEKGFYAGLNGGFVATSIKGQKVDRLGTDFGVIIGYNINRKWAIESGIISADKEYYTDGKYFDTYHLYPPSNAIVTDMTGNCRMLEIPLAVKYNINKNFFATTGITGYIMKQENYQYVYYYPASGGKSNHYKTYNQTSTYPVANLTFSTGFTKEVWYKTNVRLEPFVQIPLSKVGTGELPFTNIGLHIGLTRKLY